MGSIGPRLGRGGLGQLSGVPARVPGLGIPSVCFCAGRLRAGDTK